MNRPSFNPVTGSRIRYSDSPLFDQYGLTIVYGEDRSDPTRWNQLTGEPANVAVTVNVQQAQVAQQAQATQQAPAMTVTVQRLADNVYETYPTYTTTGNRTVRDIRNQFSRDLGLRDTMIAVVNGEATAEGVVVPAGATITFREGAKARG
jgi:hypothetical protein